MPSARARGSARGRALSREPVFRCSVAAEARGEDLAGTATHLRAVLLVEHHGPWGVAALRDSRLPAQVKRHLAGRGGVRVLLARRHLRADRGDSVQAILCLPARGLLLGATFADARGLLDLDLEAIGRGEPPAWAAYAGPVYAVCTHGRHDACCAERGRPVARALTALRPEQTWEISHVGGDRFAANVLVLPEGLYYGRTEPAEVGTLVTRHESGSLHLAHLRGRATYPMPVQYAEIALRRHLDEDRLDAVRLVAREGATCEFDHAGTRWRVTVTTTLTSERTLLTCSATRPDRCPVHEAVLIERVHHHPHLPTG